MRKGIVKTLFQTRGTVAVLDDQVSMNCLAPSEEFGVSKARPECVKTKAKISGAAKIIDMLYHYETLEAWESDGDPDMKIWVVKFVYDQAEYIAQFTPFENTINVYWVNKTVREFCNVIPAFIYAAANSDEMMDLLRKIPEIKARIGEKNASEDAELLETIYKICDSFYYGWMTGNLGEIHVSYAAVEKGILEQMIDRVVVKKIDFGKEAYKEEKKTETVLNYDSYKVDYEWDEMQSMKIPHEENYVMTPAAEKIIKKIKYRTDKVIKRMRNGKTGVDVIQNDYVNLLLVGRPASGKTKLAYAAAEILGVPVYTIPFTKNTEEDTVEGKNKVVKGQIDFVETDFLKAYQNGGIIVLEEINLADPAVVMGSLGQAIEYPFIVMKDGYEPVRRHPLCVIIGTMNTGTVGSKQLNEALSTRFKQTYILNDPSKDVFLSILKSKGFPAKNCKWVYEAYNRILKALRAPSEGTEELAENITLRSCIGALENIEEGSSLKDSIRDTMLGKIAERNLEVAQKLDREVISTLAERV